MRGDWHRAAAWCLTAVAAGLLVLLPARPALAHPVLLGSVPANGARVPAPASLVLRFSENVASRLSSVRLVDGGGRTVTGTRVRPGSPARQITVDLPRLAVGSYGAAWQAPTGRDGHVASGVLVFTVDHAARGLTLGPTTPGAGTPGAAVLRWLGLCMLAMLTGGLALAGPIFGRPPPRPLPHPEALPHARHRLLTAAGISAGLAIWVGLAQAVLEGGRGQVWLIREVALGGLAVLVYRLRRGLARPPRGRGWLPWWGCAVLLLVIAALDASIREGGDWAVVAVQATHTVSALLWVGCVAALVVLLLWRPVPIAGRDELPRAYRRPLVRLFILAAGVTVASGLYAAGQQVEFARALYTTAYGHLLLVKVAAVVALAGLGLAALVPRRLHARLLLAQLGAGLLVLVTVGLLAGAGSAQVAGPPAGQAEQFVTATAGDLLVTVSVTPNRPGVNGLTVVAASTRRLSRPNGLTVRLDQGGGARDVALLQVGPGSYVGTGQLDTGPVRLTAVIERGGTRMTVPVNWMVAAPVDARVPARLDRLTTHTAQGVLGAVLACAVWWFAVSGRRWRVRVEELEEVAS